MSSSFSSSSSIQNEDEFKCKTGSNSIITTTLTALPLFLELLSVRDHSLFYSVTSSLIACLTCLHNRGERSTAFGPKCRYHRCKAMNNKETRGEVILYRKRFVPRLNEERRKYVKNVTRISGLQKFFPSNMLGMFVQTFVWSESSFSVVLRGIVTYFFDNTMF